jgi:hypothetical protein
MSEKFDPIKWAEDTRKERLKDIADLHEKQLRAVLPFALHKYIERRGETNILNIPECLPIYYDVFKGYSYELSEYDVFKGYSEEYKHLDETIIRAHKQWILDNTPM